MADAVNLSSVTNLGRAPNVQIAHEHLFLCSHHHRTSSALVGDDMLVGL